MIRARSRGTSGRTSVTDRGVSFRIADSVDMLVSPLNGRSPVASS
jgi:hypothetical protein